MEGENFSAEFIAPKLFNRATRSGRLFQDYRNVEIFADDVSSCRTIFGFTKIAASLSITRIDQFVLNSNNNFVDVNISMNHLSSLRLDTRGKSDECFQLECLIGNILEDSHIIDSSSLNHYEEGFINQLKIDIVVLSDDGNLIDASILSVMFLLKSSMNLEIVVTPIVSVTVAAVDVPISDKDGNKTHQTLILVDPSKIEENLPFPTSIHHFGFYSDGSIAFSRSSSQNGGHWTLETTSALISMAQSSLGKLFSLLPKSSSQI